MPAANDYNIVVTCTQNTYTIGGNVSGLVTGTVTLTNLNNNDVITPGNGNYLFDQNISYAGNYNVALTQPTGQNCNIVNPNGTMPAYSVQNINVVCAAKSYSLGGSVSGFAGNTNLTLTNLNNNDTVSMGNGNFTFATQVNYHSNFNVTITQPAGLSCVFAGGSNTGTMPAANDANIVVNCTAATYTIGGNVSGLVTGNVTLTNISNADAITPANGNYLFDQNVTYGSNYNVTLTPPNGQHCSIVNPNGTMPAYSVQNINVVCSPNTYTLGGSVSGLVSSANITLTNALNADAISVGNGNFAFDVLVAYNSNFNVTITQAAGQTCAFSASSGSGTMPAANDYNIVVTCTQNTYTIGGNVSGLVTGNVTLTNLNNNDVITPGNGNYLFDQNITYASNYNVTLVSPASQHCAIVNPNGVMPAYSVQNINVLCSPNQYILGGSVSGLVTNTNVTLTNVPNSESLSVTNGNYTFAQTVAYYSNYNVTITQPTGQTCSAANAQATMPGSNDYNVTVTCTANKYSIGGLVSGLTGGGNVTLTNLNNNDTVTSVNGTYVFPLSVAYPGNYNVAVTTSAYGQVCTVVNPNGTVSNANITNANVTCVPIPYALGGSISGLAANTNVILANGADTLNRGGNGNFTFAASVGYNQTYNVTVSTQPNNQFCTVTNGSATMGNANVTNVAVACVPTYAIGGVISGLAGNTNTIWVDNGNDSLTISAPATRFVFNNRLVNGGNYNVVMQTAPAGSTCTIANANGTVAAADVTNISITCFMILSFTTNQNALWVYGQPNFTTNAGATTATGMQGSDSKVVVGNNNDVYIADPYNYRVVGFRGGLPASTGGKSWDFVLMQPSPTAAVGWSNTTPGAYQAVTRGLATSQNNLLITDSYSLRALLFNYFPEGAASNANYVLGQATLTTAAGTSCNANGINTPWGPAMTNANQILIADSGYHRVLIWTSLPTTNMGQPNLVLGQPNFTTCSSAVTQTGFNGPEDVWSNGVQVMVSDTQNSRIMVWNTFPTTNGQAASAVIGQPNYTTSTASVAGMYAPTGACSDGNSVFVSDYGYNRVTVWSGVPWRGQTPTLTVALGQPTLASGTATITQSGMYHPWGVNIVNNYLVVSDFSNYRILVFKSN